MAYDLNDLDLTLTQYTVEKLITQQTQSFDRYYFQTVIDNNDPLTLGRIKFRIDQFHRDLTDDLLPWQQNQFGFNNQFGSFKIPQMNSTILIKFLHGNFYNPVYFPFDTYKQRPIMNEDERDNLKPFNFIPSDQLYTNWEQDEFQIDNYEYNAKKIIHRLPPSWVYNYDPEIKSKIVDDLPEQKQHSETDTYDKIKDIERYDEEKIKLQLKQWGTLYLDDLYDKEYRKYSPLDDFEKELLLQVIDYDNKKIISNQYKFDLYETQWERRDQEYSGKYLEKTVLKDTTKQINIHGVKQDSYYTDLLKDNLRNDSNRITNKMDEFNNWGGNSALDNSDYQIVEELIKYPYDQSTFYIHFEDSDSNRIYKQGNTKQFQQDLYHKYHLNLTKDVYEEFEQLMYKSQTNSLLVTINNNYIKDVDIQILDTGQYDLTSSIVTPENITETYTIEQKNLTKSSTTTLEESYDNTDNIIQGVSYHNLETQNINGNYIFNEDINILDTGAYTKDTTISTPENIVKTYSYTSGSQNYTNSITVNANSQITINEDYTQLGTFSKQVTASGTQPIYFIDLIDGMWVSKIHMNNRNLLFEQQDKIEQIQYNQNILINQKVSNIDVLQDLGNVTNEQPQGTVFLKGLKIDENQTTTYNQQQLQYTLNSTTTIDITAGGIINITGQIINLN